MINMGILSTSFLTGDTEIYLDMVAIDKFFARTQPKTTKASILKDSWIKWYHSLSEWEKRTDKDVLLQARGRRNDFNLANTTTPEEREHVSDVIERGEAERGTVPEVAYFWNSPTGQSVKKVGWYTAIGTGTVALLYTVAKVAGTIIKLNPATKLLK
jgi:hypothetical protein